MELNIKAQANAVVNYGMKAGYTWNCGDGTELTGAEMNHVYPKPGKYQLLLNAQVENYTYQKSWIVEVEPMLVLPNPTITPVSGPVPLEIVGNVNPKVTGGPTRLKYTWDVAGEIITADSFKHKFTEPGTYRVLLKTSDELHPNQFIGEETIIVKALPPQITLNPKTSISAGIVPLAVTFDPGMEIKGSPTELMVRWDFGDGESSSQLKPVHIYKEPGDYQVQLIVSDRAHPGNLSSASIKVTANPPEIKVSASANAKTGIVPLTVNFNAQTGVTGSPCEPLYIWNFGDGETSYEQNPAHVYRRADNFTVTLEVQDRFHPGSKVQTTLQIETRLPKLKLTASVTPTTGTAPLAVQCRAWGEKEGSTNPVLKYTWDFGDGTKAEGLEPKHTFERAGTYNVTVTVEDPALGLKEDKTFKVTVKSAQ
jgi:PKD repeat protein